MRRPLTPHRRGKLPSAIVRRRQRQVEQGRRNRCVGGEPSFTQLNRGDHTGPGAQHGRAQRKLGVDRAVAAQQDACLQPEAGIFCDGDEAGAAGCRQGGRCGAGVEPEMQRIRNCRARDGSAGCAAASQSLAALQPVHADVARHRRIGQVRHPGDDEVTLAFGIDHVRPFAAWRCDQQPWPTVRDGFFRQRQTDFDLLFNPAERGELVHGTQRRVVLVQRRRARGIAGNLDGDLACRLAVEGAKTDAGFVGTADSHRQCAAVRRVGGTAAAASGKREPQNASVERQYHSARRAEYRFFEMKVFYGRCSSCRFDLVASRADAMDATVNNLSH